MKTKIQHTPGPVIVECENGATNFEDSIRIKWKSYTSKGVPVFTVQHYPARLIAAASDLLRHLKVAEKFYREGLEATGGCDHMINICSCDLVYELEGIQKAIAKAEGK